MTSLEVHLDRMARHRSVLRSFLICGALCWALGGLMLWLADLRAAVVPLMVGFLIVFASLAVWSDMRGMKRRFEQQASEGQSG